MPAGFGKLSTKNRISDRFSAQNLDGLPEESNCSFSNRSSARILQTTIHRDQWAFHAQKKKEKHNIDMQDFYEYRSTVTVLYLKYILFYKKTESRIYAAF